MAPNFSVSKLSKQATATVANAKLPTMNIGDVRRAAMVLLLDEDIGPDRGKKQRLAARIGKHPAQVSQWLSGYRTIEEGTAREIERKTGKPERWMDEVESPEKRKSSSIGQGFQALMDAGKPLALVQRLQSHLAQHSATRRRVIGALLAQLAEAPDDQELAHELAQQLEQPSAKQAA